MLSESLSRPGSGFSSADLHILRSAAAQMSAAVRVALRQVAMAEAQEAAVATLLATSRVAAGLRPLHAALPAPDAWDVAEVHAARLASCAEARLYVCGSRADTVVTRHRDSAWQPIEVQVRKYVPRTLDLARLAAQALPSIVPVWVSFHCNHLDTQNVNAALIRCAVACQNTRLRPAGCNTGSCPILLAECTNHIPRSWAQVRLQTQRDGCHLSDQRRLSGQYTCGLRHCWQLWPETCFVL
jgi:hypothetical protein